MEFDGLERLGKLKGVLLPSPGPGPVATAMGPVLPVRRYARGAHNANSPLEQRRVYSEAQRPMLIPASQAQFTGIALARQM